MSSVISSSANPLGASLPEQNAPFEDNLTFRSFVTNYAASTRLGKLLIKTTKIAQATANLPHRITNTTNATTKAIPQVTQTVTETATTLSNAVTAAQAAVEKMNENVSDATTNLKKETKKISTSLRNTIKIGTCLSILLAGAKLYTDAVKRRKIPLADDPLRNVQLWGGAALAVTGAIGTAFSVSSFMMNYFLPK